MSFTLKLPFPSPCAECGMESAYHRVERWSLVMDELTQPLFRPLDVITRRVLPLMAPVIDRAAPIVAGGLARLGLGTLARKPGPYDSETNLALWSEARVRGIDLRQFYPLGLRRNLFIARYHGRTCAFEGLPRTGRASASLAWMDDKAEMKKRFQQAGFPVARGGACKTEAQALTQFHALNAPVVAKPHINTAGRHTTVGIKTESELTTAFYNAKQLSPRVMIEEELYGPVFRATLINRKLVAVLRRDPPHVIGDGVRTIRQLVDEENKNPLRRGPVFAPIATDDPNISWDSIPVAGKATFFHFKVNWGVGGTSRDATHEVHPDNWRLFEDIGKYLDDDIVGVDFMIQDIGKSWQAQERCGVIECNSLPLIGNHHFPYSGPARNVAGAVWDLVFPRDFS